MSGLMSVLLRHDDGKLSPIKIARPRKVVPFHETSNAKCVMCVL